jgi:hypothetical protein
VGRFSILWGVNALLGGPAPVQYLSPAEWESRALANKQQRAQALRRREMEEAERKAARQQRQAAAAKSPGVSR